MTDTPAPIPQGFLDPAPSTCQILLVRHGQSEAYTPGQPFALVDGHGDPPLSALGEWQAVQVGDRLRDQPIDAIYASTLTRTQQTAAPLAAHVDLDVSIEPDLREVFLGDFEGGLFRLKAAEGHPAVLAMRESGDWGEIPGAESNEDLRSRTVAAIERIALNHADQTVAVFCHGGVIAALLAHAAGAHAKVFRGARNGSVNHIYVHEAEWTIRTFNDASHIGPLHADTVTESVAAALGGLPASSTAGGVGLDA